jgi:phosphatidylinositol 4-kinase B
VVPSTQSRQERLESSSSEQTTGRHTSSTVPGSRTTTSSVSTRGSIDKTPAERQRANVYAAIYGQAAHVVPFMDLNTIGFEVSDASAGLSPESTRAVTSDVANKSREAALLAVYGELWSWKEERILSASPFRGLRGMKLMPFIVKAGDDLRQEQLAIQLISQFQWIFTEESVDVYVRPFTVMSVSSDAGFVEVIPDAVSIHSLKKRTPNFVSLLDYFERAYGSTGSRSFRDAQRRFIRSMAGYSLVSYFLQIKDRHNGNIMLNAEGHIIHIDFGFMLTNSPGAIKFENVPFKLTEEYLQVICARKSVQDAAEASRTEGYRYFQELFVLGLLAARKHYEKLTTLVEIMMEGTSMPCMSGGHSVVESLRHRFCLGVSEEQCIKLALGLIDESRLSWRSASYDKFQQMQNGYC